MDSLSLSIRSVRAMVIKGIAKAKVQVIADPDVI